MRNHKWQTAAFKYKSSCLSLCNLIFGWFYSQKTVKRVFALCHNPCLYGFFMYAFNSLIFSDIMKLFPSIGVLTYMIIPMSLLIVLIMGWMIGHMTRYILKKRSRELSIYLISGIPNRTVSRLIFYENLQKGKETPTGLYFAAAWNEYAGHWKIK